VTPCRYYRLAVWTAICSALSITPTANWSHKLVDDAVQIRHVTYKFASISNSRQQEMGVHMCTFSASHELSGCSFVRDHVMQALIQP
jgi:hypothetical protein